MLARHAENMFWTGRHVERAEDTARLLDVTYHGLLESPPAEARQAWLDLLEVLHLAEPFTERYGDPSDENVTHFLVLDEDNPGSIVASVARARDNARSLREMISTELWEALNGFYLDLQSRNLPADLASQPYQLYGMVKRRCQTIAGVADETMLRDDGWRFLILGWMLERAEMTCRLLNVHFTPSTSGSYSEDFQHWVELLRSASALEAFRRHARGSMRPATVLEFLLLSRQFPRSVLFCLRSAETELGHLGPSGQLLRPQRMLGRLRGDLEFRDVEELLQDHLHHFLDQLQEGVRDVAAATASQFFRGADLELHWLGGG